MKETSSRLGLVGLMLLAMSACSHGGMTNSKPSPTHPNSKTVVDVRSMDKDRDHEISPKELDEGMAVNFNQLDINHDGVLDSKEVARYPWGSAADQNKNGQVTIMEFLDGAQAHYSSLKKQNSGNVSEGDINGF